MGKQAPSPNTSAITATQASVQAANQNYALGNSELAFEQQQFNSEQPLVQATNAATEQFQQQAQAYASPDQLAVNAGAAEANAADSMAAQHQTANTNLESMGINPSSGAYAGLQYGYGAATGAAEAGAGTTALQQTKLQGLGLEAQSVGLGNSTTSADSGNLTAGANAASGTTAFTNAGTNAENANTSAVGGFNTAQEQGFAASQAGAAGLGSLVGGLSGGILNNTNISSTGALSFGAATGGSVPSQGIPSGGTPGGSVPLQASPSQGINTDDVPANLTAGEFVMPKDVSAWYGQKFLASLVDKARQQQQQQSQRTDVGGRPARAIPAPPTFVSRPQGQQPAQAIPARAA